MAEKAGLVVARRGGLGDTLLCLPLLAALRRRWPGERLLFAGHGDFLEPVRRSGLAEEVRSVEGWEPLRELWRRGGPVGEVPAAWRGCRRVLIEWQEEAAWGPVRLFDPRPEPGMKESMARQLLRRFDLEGELPWPPPPPLAQERVAGAEGEGPVVLHPGAGSVAKMWGLERFQELAAGLEAKGRRVVLVGGPAEAERGLLPPGARCLTEVAELMELLAGAGAYVGNDSGPTHLAAAMDVPTHALFGPTDPVTWSPPWPAATAWGRTTPSRLLAMV